MAAQSRHINININIILAYVKNQPLFDKHAGESLLQSAAMPVSGAAQADGER